jgi:predicted ATP-dependent endonuclease of OLD family
MKIVSLAVKNYRTLEDISLSFPSFYTAICGANDSGKTNVVRAIRALMKEDTGLPFPYLGSEQELSMQEDFPKWKTSDSREIEFKIELFCDREATHSESANGAAQPATHRDLQKRWWGARSRRASLRHRLL